MCSAGRREAARPVGVGTQRERVSSIERARVVFRSGRFSRPATQAGPAELRVRRLIAGCFDDPSTSVSLCLCG